jgi:hypothetical protein
MQFTLIPLYLRERRFVTPIFIIPRPREICMMMYIPWPVVPLPCLDINYSKQPGQNQINRDALSKNSFNSRAPRINYVSQLAAAAVRIGTLARRSRQPPAPHIQMTHVCVCIRKCQWRSTMGRNCTCAHHVQIKRCACHARSESVKLRREISFSHWCIKCFFTNRRFA